MTFFTKILTVDDKAYDAASRTACDSTDWDGEMTRASLAEVMDIFRRGVQCDVEEAVEPGTKVMIDLGQVGWKPAIVTWALTGSIGCQFATHLSHEELASTAERT